MRTLAAALMLLALTGCATAPAVPPAPAYPAWLEMKDGYAESCIADGGCAPVSRKELEALAMEIHKRTLAMCARGV